MSGQQEPVEVIHVDDDSASVASGMDHHQLHAWLRTAGAIGAMLALFWIGASAAGMRDANERQICFTEIQMAQFPTESERTEEDLGDRLVERADECGLPLTADRLRQRYDVEESQ